MIWAVKKSQEKNPENKKAEDKKYAKQATMYAMWLST